jgi:hypothetical protein
VLGKTGRNFAAGMSGGMAYVYDEDGQFAKRCNTAMVSLERKCCPRPSRKPACPAPSGTTGQTDEAQLKKLLEDHNRWTGSKRARELLDNWAERAPSSSRCSRTSTSVRWVKSMQKKAAGPRNRLQTAAATKKVAAPSKAPQLSTAFKDKDNHGKSHRLHGIRAHRRGLQARARAPEALQGIRHRPGRRAGQGAGGALHGLRHAVLQQRLPGQQHHSGLQRLVYRGDWKNAIDVLHSTNNFPEFTGRICPAPCEAACTLNVNDDAVGIKSIEHAIIDRAWAEGWVQAATPQAQDRQEGGRGGLRPGRHGGGPAAGARRPRRDPVREERPRRRPAALRHSRLQDGEVAHRPPRGSRCRPKAWSIRTGVLVGAKPWARQQGHQLGQGNHHAEQLQKDFDAVLLTGGAEQSRDLPVPGRDLDGIHFAMEFLPQQNKVNAGDKLKGQLRADGKHVIVIGGGDTGSDCVGTSNRHGAASVTQFEVMPQPPVEENRP